jgi:hypothetical protein
MYWNNIDQAVIDGQRQVFNALGIPLRQHNADRVQHGDWMDRVVASSEDEAVIVFCDIDAFPITFAAYQKAIEHAKQGGLFGLAQFSNHKPTQQLYAGPMFIAFSKKLWYELKQPSLKRTKSCDAGEALSRAAFAHHKPVHLIKPTSCLEPKWALKDQGVFGIGTFYGECEFFHLFESRQPEHEIVFTEVVNDILNGRPLQFDLYLRTMRGHQKPRPSFWKKVFGK